MVAYCYRRPTSRSLRGLRLRPFGLEPATDLLKQVAVLSKVAVTSANRMPIRMFKIVQEALSERVRFIIALAGGAAHLTGMVAALTPLPVIGVRVKECPRRARQPDEYHSNAYMSLR